MSSFTRNRHRANSARRSRAFGAGLALTLASGAALANGAHRFMFTAYTDAVGGAEIMTGRYQAALEELSGNADSMALDPSALDTNRCIAYSMTLQWQQAHAACDAAIRAAITQRSMSPAWWGPARTSDDEYLALAYANRAVMYWLAQDGADAQKDLARAQDLSPRSDFVAQNVAALKVHRTVALAAARAPTS